MLAEMSNPTWITVIVTALIGIGGVLKWIGKHLDKVLDLWIEAEKAKTERIKKGTEFLTECMPIYNKKLDNIVETLDSVVEKIEKLQHDT